LSTIIRTYKVRGQYRHPYQDVAQGQYCLHHA
jgi:hypothetical protein